MSNLNQYIFKPKNTNEKNIAALLSRQTITYVMYILLITLTIKNTIRAIILFNLNPSVLLNFALYKYQLVSISGTVVSNIYACAISFAYSDVNVTGAYTTIL